MNVTVFKLHQLAPKTQVIKDAIEAGVVIWMDFEARSNEHPPRLVGMQTGEKFKQLIFHNSLASAADAKGIELVSWNDFLLNLASFLSAGAFIAGYSAHERMILEKDFNQLETGMRPKQFNYIDCNAKKWYKDRFPREFKAMASAAGDFSSVGLKQFLKIDRIGYDYPRHLGSFQPATRLHQFEQQSIKHGDYANWSKGSKRAWTNLLKYNEHDVRGMKHLTEWILAQ